MFGDEGPSRTRFRPKSAITLTHILSSEKNDPGNSASPISASAIITVSPISARKKDTQMLLSATSDLTQQAASHAGDNSQIRLNRAGVGQLPPIDNTHLNEVLAELDDMPGDLNDEDEDYDECDDYEAQDDNRERFISVEFPPEIQDHFGVGAYDFPIRKLLEWAARDHPHDASTLNEIRDLYYGGDHIEDYVYEWGYYVRQAPYPTIEEAAIRRVARAARSNIREARRIELEIDAANDLKAFEARQIAIVEGTATLMEQYLFDCQKDRDPEILKKWQDLEAGWDAFILARQNWSDAKSAANDTPTRQKLQAMHGILKTASSAREAKLKVQLEAAWAPRGTEAVL